jgi:hypothetical protein
VRVRAPTLVVVGVVVVVLLLLLLPSSAGQLGAETPQQRR